MKLFYSFLVLLFSISVIAEELPNKNENTLHSKRDDLSIRHLTWNQFISDSRSVGEAGKPMTSTVVYFGGDWTKVARGLSNGTIKTYGSQVVIVSSKDRCINPITNTPVDGIDLMRFFQVNAGTMMFFDKIGIPLIGLNLPQVFHANDAKLIESYIRYLSSESYNKISLTDYCKAIGNEDIIVEALKRAQGDGFFKMIKPGDKVLNGKNYTTKENFNPMENPGTFTIYTNDTHSALFIAQINEILYAFGNLNPQIAIVCPDDQIPDLDHFVGFNGILVHAKKEDIESLGKLPKMLFVARTGTAVGGMEFTGFQPSPVIAVSLRLQVQQPETIYPDIPHTETDDNFTILEENNKKIIGIVNGKTAKDIANDNKPVNKVKESK